MDVSRPAAVPERGADEDGRTPQAEVAKAVAVEGPTASEHAAVENDPESPNPESPNPEGSGSEGADSEGAEPAPAGPRPLGVATVPTGHGAVDGLLRNLAEVDQLEVSGHLAVYQDVHQGLRDTLTALDQRTGPPPPAS